MWEQSLDLKLLLVTLKPAEATQVVVFVSDMEVPEPAAFAGLRMHKMEVEAEVKTGLKL